MTSNIKIVKPAKYKSINYVVEYGRRFLRFLQVHDVKMVAVVAIGKDGKVHVEHTSGISHVEKDMLLQAIEDLHEDVYREP